MRDVLFVITRLVRSLFRIGRVGLVIRNSFPLVTLQFGIFRTQDATEIDALYEEVASVIDKQSFFRLFDIATREPHSFLWVDLITSDDSKRFHINFDQPVLVNAVDQSDEHSANGGGPCI